MRVVAGLDQRAFAVEIDEQVVRVAGEQQLGRALVLQLHDGLFYLYFVSHYN